MKGSTNEFTRFNVDWCCYYFGGGGVLLSYGNKLVRCKMKMRNEIFLEMSAEIAEQWLEDHKDFAVIDYPYITQENGDVTYTEEAQEIFNDVLDTVKEILQDYVEVVT